LIVDDIPSNTLNIQAVLGEGALWDDKKKLFRFVDIKSNTIYSYDPLNHEILKFKAPEQIGFIIPVDDGGFIAGLKSGLHYFDQTSNVFTPIINPEPQYENNRLNDACVDKKGRLFFGTMDDGEKEPSGAIYMFDGKLSKIDSDITITNGPCISPCGNYLYYADTLAKIIYKSVADKDGTFSSGERFIDLRDQDGFVDGPVCDSSGNLWICLFFGWAIRVYSPDGVLIETIKMPVSNITKASFGGDDLQHLYITTAKIGLSESQASEQPLAGNVFTIRTKIKGNPTNYFKKEFIKGII
jgi:sugar lactone lactonase YvrE